MDLNRRTAFFLTALLGAVGGAGCGDRVVAGDRAVTDGSALVPDARGAADGGGPDRSSDLRPATDTLPPSVEGLLYLVESMSASGAQQGAAYAFFTPKPHPFFTAIKQFPGTCAQMPLDEVGPVQYSAGKVTFSGPGFVAFDLEPDKQAKPDEWLYPGMLNPEYFADGGTVNVKATGDQVPAFDVTGTGVGDLGAAFPAQVSRGKPLTVAFKPRQGAGWLSVVGQVAGNAVVSIRCTLDTASGKATLPASLWTEVPQQVTQVRVEVGAVKDTVHQIHPRVTLHVLTHHLRFANLKLLP